MRFSFDPRKSERLRANPKRGIGFEEAKEVFSRPYWLDQRSDVPEQYVAIGWIADRLYSVIFEVSGRRRGRDSASGHSLEVHQGEIALYEENC